MPARVELRNVSKSYDGKSAALQDVSLCVEKGEFVVLVGPSGCGKSTLLRTIAGLEDADRGEILFDQKVVNQASPQQRNVAMVFQNYAVYPHMTVRDNLAFPLKMQKLSASLIKSKVAETAKMLDIEAYLKRMPAELSGGQLQRVAMGRALVRDPSVFLMDEPLSNLDAALRQSIRAEIAQLQRRLGVTTIYVTHDQVEAMTLGSRVAVLNEGRLQQFASARELYDKPANVFVARFIGSPPMNIFRSRLRLSADGGAVLSFGDDTLKAEEWYRKAQRSKGIDIGEKRVFGLRADAFKISKNGKSDIKDVKIEHLELLGHEQLVYFNLGCSSEFENAEALEKSIVPFSARVPADIKLSVGERISLNIDASKLHMFD